MTYSELVSKAIRAEGMELETVRGKPFRVGVFMDCPYFIPLSTGLGRSDGKKAAARFLDRWNELGSVRTTDYHDVTRNASYFIALMIAEV